MLERATASCAGATNDPERSRRLPARRPRLTRRIPSLAKRLRHSSFERAEVVDGRVGFVRGIARGAAGRGPAPEGDEPAPRPRVERHHHRVRCTRVGESLTPLRCGIVAVLGLEGLLVESGDRFPRHVATVKRATAGRLRRAPRLFHPTHGDGHGVNAKKQDSSSVLPHPVATELHRRLAGAHRPLPCHTRPTRVRRWSPAHASARVALSGWETHSVVLHCIPLSDPHAKHCT